MTITTPDAAQRFHARLGTAPDGADVTVHAYGNILIQGASGSGKTGALDTLSAQWRKTPGVAVVEIRCTPRDRHGRWGWHFVFDGDVRETTWEGVRTFLTESATAVREDAYTGPTILVIEELRPTDHLVVEAVETLLTFGRSCGLDVVFTTYPLPELLRPLRRWCATRIYVDPTNDHSVDAADAIERARKSGQEPLRGPGSFIVANDRCDVGRVPHAPGEETL